MSSWEPVIGLELHARLATQTKLFCSCSFEYGSAPNSRTCPICLAYPGALPSLNGKAVELAIRVALATGCTVHERSVFARKNYFYADLPKGYQISQDREPLATGGSITIRTASGSRRTIRIQRIHLEEDAGKSMHDRASDAAPLSLVDLNRAGSPLIEIVTEPDLRSADEAIACLTRLRQIVMYVDACDGNMEEGSLRCDANVSVHRPGEPFGRRVEIKNVNSFRFIGKAIDHEIERQIATIESMGVVAQETRLFDPSTGETHVMRSKEEASDYRYFPEPDLPPLSTPASMVDGIRATLPPLPDTRAARYMEEWSIPAKEADALVATRQLAEYFEETQRLSGDAKAAANWVRNEVLRVLNEEQIDVGSFTIRPDRLAALLKLLDDGTISGKTAKDIFEQMRSSTKTPAEIVEELGLVQMSDPAELRSVAAAVLDANPKQLEQYRGGKMALFGFFVGQIMKQTGGKANAELASSILRELLAPHELTGR
jgi:aspartyl-tRNA(Asn)/glutamyl-tRNA(Gln) amidotransferase subunit B